MTQTQTKTSKSEWLHTKLKPLSVNEAYYGKKTKTAKYRKYEQHLLRTLEDAEIPEGELEVRVVVYYSNKRADIDNCLKPVIDVFQKRYGFDDNRIYRLRVTKVIVPKGEESIAFRFLPFTPSGEKTNGNAKG